MLMNECLLFHSNLQCCFIHSICTLPAPYSHAVCMAASALEPEGEQIERQTATSIVDNGPTHVVLQNVLAPGCALIVLLSKISNSFFLTFLFQIWCELGSDESHMGWLLKIPMAFDDRRIPAICWQWIAFFLVI